MKDARTRAPLDEAAFKQQLLEVIPAARAFARGLCGRRDLADDLAQETMMKAWASRASYDDERNFKGWIFTILRNHYFSHRRKMSRVADWDPSVAEQKLVAHPGQQAAIEIADLHRAMKALPAEQREALLLVGAGGFSYEEAAAVTGCAIGTVKSRVNRARAALTKLVEQAHDDARLSGKEAVDEILADLARVSPGASS